MTTAETTAADRVEMPSAWATQPLASAHKAITAAAAAAHNVKASSVIVSAASPLRACAHIISAIVAAPLRRQDAPKITAARARPAATAEPTSAGSGELHSTAIATVVRAKTLPVIGRLCPARSKANTVMLRPANAATTTVPSTSVIAARAITAVGRPRRSSSVHTAMQTASMASPPARPTASRFVAAVSVAAVRSRMIPRGRFRIPGLS
jgi:hypothetical protein